MENANNLKKRNATHKTNQNSYFVRLSYLKQEQKQTSSMASHASNLWVLLGLGIAGILLAAKKLKKTIREDFGAFTEKLLLLPPPPPAPPKAPHPLTGLSFAISDL